jgi:redox-sensitive bicupin YhaK (pirin superfamily)
MKTIIHRAADRGIQDHGWLQAAHSFSFGSFYNPSKERFGLLRVLNDDTIAPAMGFGTHGHDNMEIVTIPLRGALAHKDSLGSEGIIGSDEVQIMSAGSGIRHSEFNASKTEDANLLQIWVFPKEKNIKPRYDQKKFDPANAHNKFQTVVSPVADGDAMWINQDAFFSLGSFEEETVVEYAIKHPGNGAYVFVIEGEAHIDESVLNKRDAAGIVDADKFVINAAKGSKILVIDVPMNQD